jgi:uncharacterized membrane protein YfcA
MNPYLLSAGLSLIAGGGAVVSTFTGLGGGTFLVAVMFALDLDPMIALPVHAAVQLFSNGARTVAFARHLSLRAMGLFFLGAGTTPFLLAPYIKEMDPQWIRLGMAVFILVLTWLPSIFERRVSFAWGVIVAGVLAGGPGMVVGATGVIIAPFFLREDWSKETVIATKAGCQALAHVIKTIAFSSIGFSFLTELYLIVPMSAAVIAGTYVGKGLVGRISERTFRVIFRGLLTVLAVELFAVAGYKIVTR